MRVRHVQGAFWGASRATLGGTSLSASRRVRLCPPHGGFVGPAHALWILRYWPRLNEGVDAPNRNLAFWHVRLECGKPSSRTDLDGHNVMPQICVRRSTCLLDVPS